MLALNEIDPIFEDERADLRNGILISSLFHMFDENSTVTPQLFMPFLESRQKKPAVKVQSAEEQISILSQVVALHNAATNARSAVQSLRIVHEAQLKGR